MTTTFHVSRLPPLGSVADSYDEHDPRFADAEEEGEEQNQSLSMREEEKRGGGEEEGQPKDEGEGEGDEEGDYYEEEEYYYEDDEEDDYEEDLKAKKRFGNLDGDFVVGGAAKTFQPAETSLESKWSHRIDLEDRKGSLQVNAPNSFSSVMKETGKKQLQQRVRVHEKKDRATTEQCLDPRTRLILYKMLNRGLVSEINGCLSTGKEANVYYGKTEKGDERAIKVYKTSILSFKDRDRYVTGEFRFRRGYCKSNPRKMVRVWAEKEFRNLTRLKAAGICCPDPVALRMHVLVMSFLGKNGWAAPKLKDAELTEEKLRECYLQCVKMMRKMYQECHLVHADLSEYNILYHKGILYFIDVSQSVEHDHPHALEFLRMDCSNINSFFKKRGVASMSIKELFDFIIDPTITTENMDAYLDKIQEHILQRGIDLTPEEELDEQVWKKSYIPSRLDAVLDAEKDVFKVKEEGSTEGLNYQKLTGLKDDLSGTLEVPEILAQSETPEKEGATKEEKGKDKVETKDKEAKEEAEGEESDEEEGEESEDEDEDKEGEGEGKELTKKERKKQVKAMQRERRMNKVPKKLKKRKKKATIKNRGKKR
ncbi:Serine/threonine-protein kinase RIO1 [Balamuthia mandrillaris]